jgi:hypothetical protein
MVFFDKSLTIVAYLPPEPMTELIIDGNQHHILSECLCFLMFVLTFYWIRLSC